MWANEVRVEQTRRGSRLCATVGSDKRALDPLDLWVEFVGLSPDRLIANGDAFVPALLWSAMKLGEPLMIGSGISPVMRENIEAIQIISAAWIPGLQRVPVETHGRVPLAPSSGRGLFFSCGVDSFYSLLKHSSSLTHLMCVQGFDMSLEEDAPFARLFSATREVAGEMGLSTLEVRTNIRALTDRFFPWPDIFASGLATVALSAQGVLGNCTFGTDTDYNHLAHRGSHPALDHLWSTENLTLIHDGYELTRLDKVRRVGDLGIAMRHLRVCLEDPAAYNCSRCEKCIRTMLELQAVGALDRCHTLPRRLRPADVARVRIKSGVTLQYFRELEQALADSDANRQILLATRKAVRAFTVRRQYYRLREAVARVPGGRLLISLLENIRSFLGLPRN